MSWEIGNIYHYKNKPWPENAVYIARAGKGLAGSPLANPFAYKGVKSAHKLFEVDDPIKEFRRYLYFGVVSFIPSIRNEIHRLALLPDGILMCYCWPKPCHGTPISRCIQWYRAKYFPLDFAPSIDYNKDS